MNLENPRAIHRMFDEMHPTIIFFSKGDDLKSQEFAPFVEVAEKYSGPEFSFLYGVEGGETAEEFGEYVGIDGHPQVAAIKVINDEDMDKFIYSGEWDAKELGAWVQKFKDGEAEKHFKTEPVPSTNDGAVKTVVGTTFEDLVFDEGSHVFLEVYAAWCNTCKKVRGFLIFFSLLRFMKRLGRVLGILRI